MPHQEREQTGLHKAGLLGVSRKTALCAIAVATIMSLTEVIISDFLPLDTGHKALCPVSLPRTRAYYGRVPGILWG